VRVYDRAGNEAIVLPIVDAVVSWRTLLHAELRLHSLAIDGPRLSLRRDKDGTISVAGIRLDERDKGDSRLADWLLEQREIEVRNAEIGWLDEKRGAPPLALSQLNFRLRNEDYEHQFGLSARPPASLGSALEVRAELTGASVRQIQSWSGRVFAELGTTELAGWRAWFDYPVDLRNGNGAVRMWTTLIGGEVRRATADLALTGVVGQLAKDLPVLKVASVRGRLHGRKTDRGYEFGARELALVSGRGPEMHATSFQVTFEPAAEGRPQHGVVNADLLELEPLARLAEFLPFPADLRKVLGELAPEGNLLDARFDWTGELPDASSLNLKTRFEGLAMNAWRTVPGFSGLSGSVDASEAKGTLHLASQNASLELPKVFPEPRVALEVLTGQVQWDRPASGPLSVRLNGLAYGNRDLAGTASGTYQRTGDGPGTLDLSAQLGRANAKNLARYLPLAAIVGEATRDWLAQSIRAGPRPTCGFASERPARFPCVDPRRPVPGHGARHRRRARIREGLAGHRGDRRRSALRAQPDGNHRALGNDPRHEDQQRQGRHCRSQRPAAHGERQRRGADRRILPVHPGKPGAQDDRWRYRRNERNRQRPAPPAPGPAAAGPAEDQVAGEYQFTGNTAVVDVRLPAIEKASGRVGFTESGFTVHEMRAQLLGGPVAIAGGSSADGVIAINARGEATVAGIGAVFDHPWRARLSGTAPYTAGVAIKGGRTQITFESSLRGVAATCRRLAKAAATERRCAWTYSGRRSRPHLG
jgi:uncharacterized protein YhdP